MNKRIRLYREGHPTIDGRLLVETTWAPPPLPLLVMNPNRDPALGHDGAQIIGMVDHIRRSRDGWVTGVIKTPGDPKGLYAEADFDKVEIVPDHEDEATITIKSARLRAITLGVHPAWKEMTRT